MVIALLTRPAQDNPAPGATAETADTTAPAEAEVPSPHGGSGNAGAATTKPPTAEPPAPAPADPGAPELDDIILHLKKSLPMQANGVKWYDIDRERDYLAYYYYFDEELYELDASVLSNPTYREKANFFDALDQVSGGNMRPTLYACLTNHIGIRIHYIGESTGKHHRINFSPSEVQRYCKERNINTL